jgi:hypothetical protein
MFLNAFCRHFSQTFYSVTCMGDYRRGFGLDIVFIDHLYTQPRTTINYSAIANLHNSQISTAPTKSFPACCVFTSRSLVAASSSGNSSASALKSSLNGGFPATASFPHRLQYGTDFVASVVLLVTPLHGPSRKTRFQKYLYCCMRIRCARERVYPVVA